VYGSEPGKTCWTDTHATWRASSAAGRRSRWVCVLVGPSATDPLCRALPEATNDPAATAAGAGSSTRDLAPQLDVSRRVVVDAYS
jgi:hypothetical protein